MQKVNSGAQKSQQSKWTLGQKVNAQKSQHSVNSWCGKSQRWWRACWRVAVVALGLTASRADLALREYAKRVEARDVAWRRTDSSGGAFGGGWRWFLRVWVQKCEIFRMVVEVFRSEACAEDSDEGNESFGDVFNLWWQRAHWNSDGGGRAIPEMVEAAEEC